MYRAGGFGAGTRVGFGLVLFACAACNLLLDINSPTIVNPPSDGSTSESDVKDAAPVQCGDTTGDPNNCGHCGAVCASGVCSNGTCLTLVEYGDYATTAPGNGLVPYKTIGSGDPDGGLGQFAGIPIQVARPGLLVKFGMLTLFGGPTAYVGLYAAGGVNGMPSTLLAWTDLFALKGNPTDSSNPEATIVPVLTPIMLQGDTTYWILGNWSGEVKMIAHSDSTCPLDCVEWYVLNEPFQPLPNNPDTVNPPPKSSLPPGLTPILYAIVAE